MFMGTVLIQKLNLNSHTHTLDNKRSEREVKGSAKGKWPSLTKNEWNCLEIPDPSIHVDPIFFPFLFHTFIDKEWWMIKNAPSFLPLLVIWEKTALITTCKSVIDVSQLLLDSAWVGLFLANQPDTFVFVLFFSLPHELRVFSAVGGSVFGQHGTWLLEFIDLKRKKICVTVRISGVLSCFFVFVL